MGAGVLCVGGVCGVWVCGCVGCGVRVCWCGRGRVGVGVGAGVGVGVGMGVDVFFCVLIVFLIRKYSKNSQVLIRLKTFKIKI